nr:AlpA family phage regulatory protein [Thioalkalivibrio sp. AKL8]
MKDVCQLTNLSRASIYRLRNNDAFPAPRRISRGCVRWQLSSVERWIEALPKG